MARIERRANTTPAEKKGHKAKIETVAYLIHQRRKLQAEAAEPWHKMIVHDGGKLDYEKLDEVPGMDEEAKNKVLGLIYAKEIYDNKKEQLPELDYLSATIFVGSGNEALVQRIQEDIAELEANRTVKQ